MSGGLAIKQPVHTITDNLAEQLLESLVTKGLSGQELLEKFKEASNNVSWTAFGAVKKDDSI